MANLFILIKWIFIYFVVVLIFKNYQPSYLYLIISFCFLVGFVMRKLNIYPGKEEPLILDLSAFFVSFLFFLLTKFILKIDIKITFAIILIPHILYNIFKLLKIL